MSQEFGYEYDLDNITEEDVGQVERIGTQANKEKNAATGKKRGPKPKSATTTASSAADAAPAASTQHQPTTNKVQPTITSAMHQSQAITASKKRELDVESAIRSAYSTSEANDTARQAQLLAQLAQDDDDEVEEAFDVNAILGISAPAQPDTNVEDVAVEDEMPNNNVQQQQQHHQSGSSTADITERLLQSADSILVKESPSPSTAASPSQADAKNKPGKKSAATLFSAVKMEGGPGHQHQAVAATATTQKKQNYTTMEKSELKVEQSFLDQALKAEEVKMESSSDGKIGDDLHIHGWQAGVEYRPSSSSSAGASGGSAAVGAVHKLPPMISEMERRKIPMTEDLRTASEATLRNVYWIDAKEVQAGDQASSSSAGGGSSSSANSTAGCVLLFGRIATRGSDKEPGLYKSICVRVPITRCVLFLPRDQNPANADESDMNVMREVNALCRRRGIDDRSFKFVKRMYAFEEEGVPTEEARWLKLRYSAAHPPLWNAKEAPPRMEHVKSVFGVNRSLLELLLIKRRFEGPSFLDVTNATAVPKHMQKSLCEFEFTCKSQKDVFVLSQQEVEGVPLPPKLKTASLHLRTQLDPTGKTHEIFAATISICQFDTETSTADFPVCTPHVGVRRWKDNEQTPVMLPNRLLSRGGVIGKNYHPFVTEGQLVAWILSTLRNQDPDIIIGHNIVGFSLGVLFNRVAELRPTQVWSTVGRMNWKSMPHGLAHAASSSSRSSQFGKGFWEKEVSAGRLLVDTYALAKEYHRSSSYKLLSLARELDVSGVGGPVTEAHVEEGPKLLNSAVMADEDQLSSLLIDDINFSILCVRLTHKLGLIPLTKRLAFVAGTVWGRVLNGSRAERIEYLLMHAFHRLKFVIPDKKAYGAAAAALTTTAAAENQQNTKSAGERRGRGAAAISAVGAGGEESDIDIGGSGGDDDDDILGKPVGADGAASGGDSKGNNNISGSVRAKAKFKGGSVLTPQVGLYKDYILLLDFNSLYPSLIQEFNVCFTTVDRVKGVAAREPSAQAAEPVAPTRDRLICANCAKLPNADELYPCPHRAILCKVIRSLVQGRRAVKALMKTERSPATLAQLEIRQKALKLTANSMYGCLGFSHSRFYAQKLAELVTQEGRRALAKTVEVVNACDVGQRVRVIYGDTDSVMISTGEYESLDNVKRIAEKIRKDVNKCYRHLELGMDGVFRTLLLHTKKKYAGLAITDWQGAGRTFKQEVKGLEMVRRDWCKVSKTACSKVLETALNPNLGDEVVETIGDALEAIANHVLSGGTELSNFVITKSIQRDPASYKDPNQFPHVVVALRMKKKQLPVFVGDLIPFIICVPPEPTTTTTTTTTSSSTAADGGKDSSMSPGAHSSSAAGATQSQPQANDSDKSADASTAATSQQKQHAATAAAANKDKPLPTGNTKASAKLLSERAFSPEEVKSQELSVDLQWYLATQIYPPVLRLCEHIDGFTPQFLCEKLKLPTTAVGISDQPATSAANANNNRFGGGANNFVVAFRGTSLEDMFPNVPRFIVECPSCRMREPLLLHTRAAKMVTKELPKVPAHFHPKHRKLIFGSMSNTATVLQRIPWFVCPNSECKDQILPPGIVFNSLLHTMRDAVARLNSFPDPRSSEKFEQFTAHFSYLWRLFDIPPYVLNDGERDVWDNAARFIDENGNFCTHKDKINAQSVLRSTRADPEAKARARIVLDAKVFGRDVLERYLVHFQQLTVNAEDLVF